MTTPAEMKTALAAQFVPHLRAAGFKGSFPHFHRDDEGFVCLVNIQFDALGEAFCVNLSFADPARRNVFDDRRNLAPKALRVSMTGGLTEGGNALSGRWRLGAKPLGDGLFSDSWFVFAPGEYGADRSASSIDPDLLARRCVAIFDEQAEAWWAGRRAYAASV